MINRDASITPEEAEQIRSADHAARNKRDKPRLEARREQLARDRKNAAGEWREEIGRRIAWMDRLIAMCDPEPPDSCEGEGDSLGPEEHAEGMSRTCDDCGAGPGEPCAWSCSANWR